MTDNEEDLNQNDEIAAALKALESDGQSAVTVNVPIATSSGIKADCFVKITKGNLLIIHFIIIHGKYEINKDNCQISLTFY